MRAALHPDRARDQGPQAQKRYERYFKEFTALPVKFLDEQAWIAVALLGDRPKPPALASTLGHENDDTIARFSHFDPERSLAGKDFRSAYCRTPHSAWRPFLF